MKSEPSCIEAALSHAIRIEDLEQTIARAGTSVVNIGNVSERRPRNVYAMSDQKGVRGPYPCLLYTSDAADE